MQRAHLEQLKFRLQEQRAKTESTLAGLRADLSQSQSATISEFATYDNHPADVATETYERSKDLGLQQDQRQLLEQIEAALARIETGTYGWCTECGRPIPEERLLVIPQVAKCKDCASADSRAAVRSEPELSFQSSFTDNDANENVGFDGEDTWQAVARYGTSNTPGDFRQVENYDEVYIDHDEAIGTVWEEDAIPISFDRSRDQLIPRGRQTEEERRPL